MTVEQDEEQGYFREATNTSDNTLGSLETLKRPYKETRHTEQKEAVHQFHKSMFPQFLCELRNGFNILFYGFGSKRKLLNEFADLFPDRDVLVVNGYFPSVSIGSVSKDCILIIHNIERLDMKQIPKENLILASCDHINFNLNSSNWIYHNLTTFESYSVENSFENIKMTTNNLRGISNILESVTKNSRKIFYLILEELLKDWEGVSLNLMFVKCRDLFLVSNKVTFKSFLTEFIDHQLLKIKNVNGSEFIASSLQKDVVKTLLTLSDE